MNFEFSARPKLYHVSHVIDLFIFLFFYIVVELVGGGFVINGAYPV